MKINPLLALCALPALIQPAEAASKVKRCTDLIVEGFETTISYVRIIEKVIGKKMSPAEAAKRIPMLTARLDEIQETIILLTSQLSPEEQVEFLKALEVFGVETIGSEFDTTIEEFKKKLSDLEYFESAEFKAASEDYVNTYFK